MKTYSRILKLYDEYVDTYRSEDGTLPKMMQLKRVHTDGVVANADLIAKAENFDAPLHEASLIAALLHDTGRYEQLKRYNTFRDSDSVDHAAFSFAIVREKGWIDDKGIMDAILFHNRREIPENLDERTILLSQIVRDSDKLDIFRVLEEELKNNDWRKDSRAFWNLASGEPPNPAVVEAIMASQPVDYQNIKSLSDFVLIQVGWMVCGLYFRSAREICYNRHHLDFRRKFLHQLTDSPEIDRICDFALESLAKSAAPNQDKDVSSEARKSHETFSFLRSLVIL